MASLRLIILAVDDVAASAHFYHRALGWSPSVTTPVYVEMTVDTMRFGLYARDGFARHVGELPAAPAGLASTELYIYVDDLEAACVRMRDAGGRPLAAAAPRDWGDEVAYFADPDRNVIALAKPISRT